MIDMYDLPTEAELAKAIVESAKKPIEVNEIETKTIFPFWEPAKHSGKNEYVVSDKSGVVKPKDDFKKTDVLTAWKNFMKNYKTPGNKPVTKTDTFGSIVVNTFAEKPSTDKLVGSIKAIKKTKVTELSGKTTTKTEELGVFKELAKSHAAEPNPNKLVGSIKPIDKKSLANFEKKPKVIDVSGAQTIVVDDFMKEVNTHMFNTEVAKPTKEKAKGAANGPAVLSDNTGIVKQPKA